MTINSLPEAAAVAALRQVLANLAESIANVRLLSAAIVPDHHQRFMEELDALDSVAEVMKRVIEDLEESKD